MVLVAPPLNDMGKYLLLLSTPCCCDFHSWKRSREVIWTFFDLRVKVLFKYVTRAAAEVTAAMPRAHGSWQRGSRQPRNQNLGFIFVPPRLSPRVTAGKFAAAEEPEPGIPLPPGPWQRGSQLYILQYILQAPDPPPLAAIMLIYTRYAVSFILKGKLRRYAWSYIFM